MSFIRKEDAAKAAKLGGAIVLVFGLAAWRVVGAVSPPRPASPPPETVGASTTTSPTNGEPTQDTTAASAKADDALIVPSQPVMGSMINPFRTIAPVVVAQAPVKGMPTPLPSGPLPPATPLPAVGGAVGAPAPAAATTAEEPMRLTGILGGVNATAVIEMGKDVCVVHQGVTLPDGTLVAQIAATTVTLKRAGKTRILDVGN